MFPFGDMHLHRSGSEITPDRTTNRGTGGEPSILPAEEPLWLVKEREIRAARSREEDTDEPPKSPKEEWARKPPRVPKDDTQGQRPPRSPRAVSKKPASAVKKPSVKRPR